MSQKSTWKFWNLRGKVLCIDWGWGKLDFFRLGWFVIFFNLPSKPEVSEWETSNWRMIAFLLTLHPIVFCLYIENEAFRGTFRKKPRIQKCLPWPFGLLPEVTVRSIHEDFGNHSRLSLKGEYLQNFTCFSEILYSFSFTALRNSSAIPQDYTEQTPGQMLLWMKREWRQKRE